MKFNLSLGFKWALATTTGWCIASVWIQALVESLPPPPMYTSYANAQAVLIAAFTGMILGFTTGFLQWLILRHRIQHTWLWPLLSTIGWSIYSSQSTFLFYEASSAEKGIVDTVVLSAIWIGQWSILHKQSHNAGWWIPVNVIAFVVSYSVSGAVSSSTRWWTGSGIDHFAATALVSATGGLCTGVITGCLLIWMFRYQSHKT